MINEPSDLTGKFYQFEDGDKIEVIQVKQRSEEYFLVHYMIYQGPGIPRKLVMESNEFMNTYGHLFRS
jgi:hypothetical protein